MKSIILVNQVIGPLFIDIANFYHESGFKVTILTGKVEETGASLHPSIDIVKLIRYRRKNPITRIYTWVMFFIQANFWLKKMFVAAEVFLSTNSPLIPLLSHYLKHKKNFNFRIVIYDIYPDVLERAGYFSSNSWFAKKWRRLNEKAFQHASRLFTISDGMRDVLTQYAEAERWEVVYPWVDTSFVKPLPKSENPFAKKYGLEDKIVFLYSGNMGSTHDLMPIMNIAKAVKDQSDYFFLFIGDGTEKNRLERFALENDLKNTLFLPFQDPEVLPYSFTSADIGIVALSVNASQLSIPSKTFYQMAAGNGILCIAEHKSELSKLIIKSNCGITVDSKSLELLIKELQSSFKEKVIQWSFNSRETSKFFSKDNVRRFI
ncbi:glycosyltransferase family 4 protein [Lunatimonas salinarum]|uniref:glycosyltransferase family 4 protein n=1 Tax=Lunatimonas salinarum TaxID=1774590 RepID=UPI001AE08F70|nr:glycosyltransferase family 4 protein [Lunatimonas salinarum]